MSCWIREQTYCWKKAQRQYLWSIPQSTHKNGGWIVDTNSCIVCRPTITTTQSRQSVPFRVWCSPWQWPTNRVPHNLEMSNDPSVFLNGPDQWPTPIWKLESVWGQFSVKTIVASGNICIFWWLGKDSFQRHCWNTYTLFFFFR